MEQHGTIMYLEGVTVTFDGFQALRGVDFYVDHGELRQHDQQQRRRRFHASRHIDPQFEFGGRLG